MISDTSAYHPISKMLHWLVALLVFGLLGVGLYMSDLELSPEKLKLYGLHKAFGAVVLGLMVVRLIWRFIAPPPALPDTMPHWQRKASHLAHFALYALLFAMPISGWLMSSAAGFPVSFFGWFTLPDLVPANPQMKELYNEAHEICANLLMLLIGLHIAAALKHHFVDKDGVLRRMLPGVFFVCLVAAQTGRAEQPLQQWFSIPAQSELKFTATQNNAPIEGSFQKFRVIAIFSPTQLDNSVIVVEVPLDSVALAYSEARNALLGKEWFNVAETPLATFRSTRITHSAKNNYVAEGFLYLKNRGFPTFLHFTMEEYGPNIARLKGEAVLMRTQLGVGEGEWSATDILKDEVAITFKVTASNSDPKS